MKQYLKPVLLCLFLSLSAGFCQDATIESFRAIVSNYPDRFRVINQLAVLYAEKNDLTNAERYLNLALKINRQYADAYYNLGVVRLNEGKYNEAVESLVKATVFSNDKDCFLNLGNIYNINNDYSLAASYYDKALEIDPRDADLLNNLGILALKQKDYARAYDKLIQALILKDDEDIRFNLAVAAWYYKKPEKIKELYPVLAPEMKHYLSLNKLLNK